MRDLRICVLGKNVMTDTSRLTIRAFERAVLEGSWPVSSGKRCGGLRWLYQFYTLTGSRHLNIWSDCG